jgi:hypothetical protein
VIVGGLAFGTLLTLLVVPTPYTLLGGRAHLEAHGLVKEHALDSVAPSHAD